MPTFSRITLTLAIAFMVMTAMMTSPTSASPSSCTIVVTSDQLVGTPDDERTSIGEAIGTASQLAMSSCGPRGVDIVVDPSVDSIVADGPLPPLAGVAGLTIDGRGVGIDGAGQAIGFTIASPSVTLRDMAISGFTIAVQITPSGEADLSGGVVDELDLTIPANGTGINVVAANADNSAGVIDGLVVRHSRFRGAPGGRALAAVNITGVAAGAGGQDGAIRDVLIEGNIFEENLLEQVHLVGIQAAPGAVLSAPSGPQLERVVVRENRFENCLDPCVLAYAGLSLGGKLEGGHIKDLVVLDNRMQVENLGILAIGGYTLGPGGTSNSTIEGVVVRGNDLRASELSQCTGIALIGGWTDFHAGSLERGVVSRARIVDNTVDGCETAIRISGTHANEEVAGVVRQSSVDHVLVRSNRIVRNRVGLQVTGASLRYTRVFGTSPTQSTVSASTLIDNRVRSVRALRNSFIANDTAVLLAGASIVGTNGHVVMGNQVVGARVNVSTSRLNRFGCLVLDQHVPDGLVLASGNVIDRSSCRVSPN